MSCCTDPLPELLSEEGYECLNCGRVLGHSKPMAEPALGTVRLDCEMDGCHSGRWFPLATAPHMYVCKLHEGFEACGARTIADPESGEDFTVVDGVTYVVHAKLIGPSFRKAIRLRFEGTLHLSESTPEHLYFKGEDGMWVSVPESSITNIHAC